MLHQASSPAKAMAKTASATKLRLRRMNSAAIVTNPRMQKRIAADALKTSGAGSRNHSAIALHALMGAMTTIAAMILRASPAALFTMTDLAPFQAAALTRPSSTLK